VPPADERGCTVPCERDSGYQETRQRQRLERLRVGAYRVLMTVDTVIEVSWIEEVKKRDGRTY
jgi:mRNA-degrading endonuclease RelE of RelBE toxin-antitoxin system